MTNTKKLLDEINPPIFSDGKDVFGKFMNEYTVHEKGYFILAPSGSGKTHFVNNQTEKHWIDGDDLWIAAGAHPDNAWWTMGIEIMNEVDQKSDIITMYAKKLGLWIIGASQFWLLPDAIVLPDWESHKQFIAHREKHNYDGGATSNDYDQVLGHRAYMKELAERENIPTYHSVEEAVDALTISKE